MENFPVVEGLQTVSHLNEGVPDLALLELGRSLDMLVDFPLEVTTLGELHHDAQCRRSFVKESLFVGDHVLVAKVRKTRES